LAFGAVKLPEEIPRIASGASYGKPILTHTISGALSLRHGYSAVPTRHAYSATSTSSRRFERVNRQQAPAATPSHGINCR